MKVEILPDKDEFFREFTVRICSCLTIKPALESVCNYLKEIVPLDMMILAERDESLGSFRTVAEAAVDASLPTPTILAIPKDLWMRIRSLNYRSTFLADDSVSNDVRELNAISKLYGLSHMCIPLWRDDNMIGFLSLFAKGSGKYHQAHADLFDTIIHPATIALSNALAHEELMRYRDTLIDENRFLNKELLNATTRIIGETTGLKQVIEMVKQVAPLNNTVLLLGETGTGKEIIANAIHSASPRKNGPFIKVNCGAIPEHLIDSELFGHDKGAFTGAISEKKGRFERANGGTIFLDEIGELPQLAQVRLLRVLQTREFERVGGTRAIKVDIRIIAATHRNLENMVTENRFREDLWFRLNAFPLFIPPLRQRKEDIPMLARYFLQVKSRELGLRMPPSIAPGVLSRLAEYAWPGNVRELENLVERELIRHREGPLSFDTLEPRTPPTAIAARNPGAITNLDQVNFNHISAVLEMTGGRIQGPHGAAALLGIKATTLRGRMDKLGIPYGRKN
ncbi:MAG: sigma 54-interacting transcriptional regulator [Desulfuromonadaceae bacterium]|nr:sigma 54-interacting transcriptional regulator [Desulfuromonadaceae bacterium]